MLSANVWSMILLLFIGSKTLFFVCGPHDIFEILQLFIFILLILLILLLLLLLI